MYSTSRFVNCTFLSIAAEMGLPFKARRVLACHAKASEESTLVYSRDVMAWPFRHLGRALILIKEGYFNQGSTRSGFWVKQLQSTGVEAFEYEASRMEIMFQLADAANRDSGDVDPHAAGQRKLFGGSHRPLLVGLWLQWARA